MAKDGTIPAADSDTARILYEHASNLVSQHYASEDRYVTKVDKLLIINTAMFAGIAYGVDKTDWIEALSPRWQALILGLAGVAAVIVLVAFCSGIRCLYLVNREVAGLKRLIERTASGEVDHDSPAEAYAGLANNLASALDSDRALNRNRAANNSRLNRATFCGAIAVSLFLGISIAGQRLSKGGNDVSAEPTPTQPATQSPQESSPPPAPQPTPKPVNVYIEPGDSVCNSDKSQHETRRGSR